MAEPAAQRRTYYRLEEGSVTLRGRKVPPHANQRGATPSRNDRPLDSRARDVVALARTTEDD